jgi:hypothetical protein
MRILKGLLLVGLVVVVVAAAAQDNDPAPIPLDQALKKAGVNGKYQMLLRQIRVESDLRDFGLFHDFGFNKQAECAGHKELPAGHWVYVYPYWYIWRDGSGRADTMRAWGPEQATGPANTPEPGDRQTAWASATQDGDHEWLMLEYATPVRAYAVHIYETYNPGAVVRITGFTLDGSEVELWRRARPVIPAYPGYVFRPVLQRRITTNRIKIYLDSRRVPGWNEIDAVRLRDESGGLHWAVSAHASSTYGVSESAPDPREERIRALEDENRRLRLELDALKRGVSPERSRSAIPGESYLP